MVDRVAVSVTLSGLNGLSLGLAGKIQTPSVPGTPTFKHPGGVRAVVRQRHWDRNMEEGKMGRREYEVSNELCCTAEETSCEYWKGNKQNPARRLSELASYPDVTPPERFNFMHSGASTGSPPGEVSASVGVMERN
ncbi:uncharacterized protein BDZ83DRAFT_648768 [Colletotrichum acutatum]|uniref:Uncharacterized protein n=1 Tax=Glomerella acutata TaxID=27357 RepID=A0AAD8UVF2_GLOAC|nr:uncharacterized protein BDZ83DRAFT_648768 [Colletotrichum acutatum]KAK1728513.1 hypothetical protein BDZ83DRAFT_648768 [Colletotrichum acutatum]